MKKFHPWEIILFYLYAVFILVFILLKIFMEILEVKPNFRLNIFFIYINFLLIPIIMLMCSRILYFRASLRARGYKNISASDAMRVWGLFPQRLVARLPAREEIAASPICQKRDVETVLAVLKILSKEEQK